MAFWSMGADEYESERKSGFMNEYINQFCKNMRTTPQEMRRKDPGYYKMILARASEETDKMWNEEKKLILKWKEQNKKVIESATLI
ncbi:MAG: hypothetical protein IK111_08445 [Lachnospiraceae bacterium]|nr:hypothetical protein [Lachnospiraceae bacterium]MBR6486873.1 hypothetical protein [Lachnospiraceae bacterium]